MRLTASLALILAPLGADAAENLEAALGELAAEVMSFVKDDAPKKIAISTMIHGDGTCSDLSERASNRFQGALFGARSPMTSIVDRRSLSAIFREQELVEDGTVSPEGAAKIARIAQVDAIVTGTMTTYGDQVELEASMLDAINGTVLGFAYSSFPLTGADKALLANTSVARCGFTSAPRADARQNPEVGSIIEAPSAQTTIKLAKGATFSNDIFIVEIRSLNYEIDTGIASFTMRFMNKSENKIGISYRNKTLLMTDGFGGIFKHGDVWHGIRYCDRSIGSCTQNASDYFTSIDTNAQAQLTFSTIGNKGIKSPNISFTMEFYVMKEYKSKQPYIVTLSFFDLQPAIK